MLKPILLFWSIFELKYPPIPYGKSLGNSFSSRNKSDCQFANFPSSLGATNTLCALSLIFNTCSPTNSKVFLKFFLLSTIFCTSLLNVLYSWLQFVNMFLKLDLPTSIHSENSWISLLWKSNNFWLVTVTLSRWNFCLRINEIFLSIWHLQRFAVLVFNMKTACLVCCFIIWISFQNFISSSELKFSNSSSSSSSNSSSDIYTSSST